MSSGFGIKPGHPASPKPKFSFSDVLPKTHDQATPAEQHVKDLSWLQQRNPSVCPSCVQPLPRLAHSGDKLTGAQGAEVFLMV